MKRIDTFVNELTGEEFTNKDKCIKAEKKSKAIKKMFSFWKFAPKYDTCDFANGNYCYQRTKEEFDKLIDTIIQAVKKFEPWIYSGYKKHGGLKREFVIGHTFLGRYLEDGDSKLYEYWSLQGNICPKCYREYGQMYYALHCHCNGNSESYGQSKEIPTKKIE